MASITTRKNGSRFITFHDAAGNPRHITLGQVAKRYAEAFKVRVEDLAAAALHGQSPTDDTSRWLSSLEDRLYVKLSAVGLVPERQSATIGTLVERYIAKRKDDLKLESTRKLRQTETKLLAFSDKDKSLRKITAEDATARRRSLKDLGLSEAAIRTHCGNVKTMLAEAKRRKASDGAGNEQKQGNGADPAEARNSAANPQSWRDLRLVSASPGVSKQWSRGESNPRAKTVGCKLLRVYPMICIQSGHALGRLASFLRTRCISSWLPGSPHQDQPVACALAGHGPSQPGHAT